ncbi:cyanophycin synthetase, partial [Oxalobacteraceae bacterium OM1]
GSEVLVERFIPGDEHRLLVVGGRLVAAARGELAIVTGDGVSTVEQLINSQINTDPRRGTTEDFPLNLVLIDEDPAVRLELKRQGYEPESVPEQGKQVLVQRNGNVAFDVTDKVHPEVAAVASLAARVVGLDIAGVDLVAEDISRPLEAQGGAIVEVNAGPGLLMHLKPANGEARPVGQAIVDHLFGAEESGRIPVVGVAGTKGKTMVARLIARLLTLQGNYVGLACSEGLFFNERRIRKTDSTGWESAQRIFLNRAVEAAVVENSCRTMLAEGLAYDRCQVGVVTNLDRAATLPEYYVETEEQLRNVVRTQVDVVLPEGAAVLNAADAQVAGLAELCDGEVVFFASSQDAGPIAAHLAHGGRAVFLRGEQIMFAHGKEETAVSQLADVALAIDITQPGHVENVLAAVAAAWALDLPVDLIRDGIEAVDDVGADKK